MPKISKFVQKIAGIIKNNKYLKQVGNFIKNIPSMIKNNKFVQKVGNAIKNNKLVKKVSSFITNNKYVKKAASIVKNGWNSIKKLPSKIMNTLKSTKNNIAKNYNQIKNKAINYIKDNSNKLSYNFKKITSNISKFKSKWNKFNEISSKISGVIGWVSRPDKKVFSKIINYGYKKYVGHNRSILKSKNVSKIVKNGVYKKSLIAKAVNTYISNPVRTFKNVLFPDTKKIKNNIHNAVSTVKKYNPINHIKSKVQNYRRGYVRRRFYKPVVPKVRVYTRRIVNRVVSPVRRVVAPVRSGLNRLGSFARKLIFRR